MEDADKNSKSDSTTALETPLWRNFRNWCSSGVVRAAFWSFYIEISLFTIRLYILYHKPLQNTNPCPAKLYKCPLQKNRQIDHQIGARSYFPPVRAGLCRFWGCKKARPVSDGPFCTRSGISPVRCPPTAVKENSRRRMADTRYSKNKKKKIS